MSEVAADGKEKNANQWFKKALVQEAASATSRGTAWTNLVVLQTMVSIYLNPLDFGNGPRMSRLI